MNLVRTIRELEAGIAAEDTDIIYAAVAELIEQIGDEATSAIADALLAERRRVESLEPEVIFASCA